VIARTLAEMIPKLEPIDRHIASLEARRMSILREIERRRQGTAHRQRLIADGLAASGSKSPVRPSGPRLRSVLEG
jgi:hypothetical protein